MRYATLLKAIELNDEISKVTVVPDENISEFRESYPNIPEDYLDYLKEVGNGEYLYGLPNIYGGPIDVDEIFPKEDYPEINENQIFLIGDWGNGDAIGYLKDEDTYSLVEVLHEDDSISYLYGTFAEFIDERLREYAEEEDLMEELGLDEE